MVLRRERPVELGRDDYEGLKPPHKFLDSLR